MGHSSNYPNGAIIEWASERSSAFVSSVLIYLVNDKSNAIDNRQQNVACSKGWEPEVEAEKHAQSSEKEEEDIRQELSKSLKYNCSKPPADFKCTQK